MRPLYHKRKILHGLVKCVILTFVSGTSLTDIPKNFGGIFESDGRLQGNLTVQTVACTNNVCQVQVPAPGFALVFFTDTAFTESTPENPQTFSTTALTKTKNTATVDAAVLATSNGHRFVPFTPSIFLFILC
jgi:hypothetical protein